MSRGHSVGEDGESRAAEFLKAHGLTVITRRFRTRHGEIDLVALDGDLIVFAEVKARQLGGLPEEAVNAVKLSRIRRTGQEYLQRMGEPDRPFRIDVVAVEGAEVRWHRGVESESSWQPEDEAEEAPWEPDY